jgi:hypothetical protein
MEPHSRMVWSLVFISCLIILAQGALADCPSPPNGTPEALWTRALANARMVSREGPERYHDMVSALEVRALFSSYPTLRSYPYQGRAFAYVLIRSAFCRELSDRFSDSFEIQRRFESHDVILADTLGIGTYGSTPN